VDLVEEKWRNQQATVCERFGVERLAPDPALNCGVSNHFLNGMFQRRPTWPVHGCRHLPTATTTGWYLWAGELSDADDFFKPVHAAHLETWAADAMPYLGLPPGWRFLLAPDHEDVWFDESLLVA
jgi:hypothetical protein